MKFFFAVLFFLCLFWILSGCQTVSEYKADSKVSVVYRNYDNIESKNSSFNVNESFENKNLTKLSSKKNHNSQSFENRYALVIGNGNYPLYPLKNAKKDAADISSLLNRFGFEVMYESDVNFEEMDVAIDKFYWKIKNGGVGLFYFAGHGVQVGNSNYLIPTDVVISSESDVRYKCIDVGRILGKIEDAGNKMNVVILDACRNNPFSRSYRSINRGLAQMDAPAGTLIAYSTSPGKVASDGDGENSVYTKNLLHYISTTELSIYDIFMHTRIAVMKETDGKQIPWESSSLTGYFYFNN